MKRGTIRCRKDPLDPAEWQFQLNKSIAWNEEEKKHEMKGENAARAEVAHWMELRAGGLLEDGNPGGKEATEALDAVMNKQNQLALQDQEDDEGDTGASGSKDGKKKENDEQVVEADLLSEMGGKASKEEAHKRVTRMVKLVKTVKKAMGATKGKALDKTLSQLTKLESKGKNLKLEEAKNTLFDAALEIKKVKRQ